MSNMNKNNIAVLYFDDSHKQAIKLANALEVAALPIKLHHFPDNESLVTLPTRLPEHVIFFRSLNDPNSKLIELLFAAKTASRFGARRLSLIAPYLCYMRQDAENNPGEAISQQIVGQTLAELFDDVLTVDSHLHRISHLQQAIPCKNALNILTTQAVAQFIKKQFKEGILLGPDAESEQWVKQLAELVKFPFTVANKIRSGDKQVTIELAKENYADKDIIIVDDMASTGRTIGLAAKLLKAEGARSISAIVTHALFFNDAKNHLAQNHVENIWSTDSITDDTNSIELTELLAEAVLSLI